MKLGDFLEWPAAAAFVAAGYLAVGPWLALLVLGACLAYLAQVCAHVTVRDKPLRNLKLGPEDVLIARVPAGMSPAAVANAHTALQSQSGHRRVVVIPEGVDLATTTPDGGGK
jgi:hypothetical protein